jgi:hypothetical protein
MAVRMLAQILQQQGQGLPLHGQDHDGVASGIPKTVPKRQTQYFSPFSYLSDTFFQCNCTLESRHASVIVQHPVRTFLHR